MKTYNVEGCGVNFELELKDKLLLVGGDSGAGKTLLYKAIQSAASLEPDKYVLLNYNHIYSEMIDIMLKTARNKLIVIDNADIILNNEQKIKRIISIIVAFIHNYFNNKHKILLLIKL